MPHSENKDGGEINSQELLRKKYEERKALIFQPDEKLIEFARRRGNNFRDSTIYSLTENINHDTWDRQSETRNLEGKKLKSLLKKLRNYSLVDIGCGDQGAFQEGQLLGVAGIKKIIAIDPFLSEDDYYFSRQEIPENRGEVIEKFKKDKCLEFIQDDGLSYLKSKEDNSANALTSSIDNHLIRDDNYLKRLAQEIFRTVPEDGVFVSLNSFEIEQEAGKLFPYIKHFLGDTTFFSKTPFEE